MLFKIKLPVKTSNKLQTKDVSSFLTFFVIFTAFFNPSNLDETLNICKFKNMKATFQGIAISHRFPSAMWHCDKLEKLERQETKKLHKL